MYHDYYLLSCGFQPHNLTRNQDGYDKWKFEMLTVPFVLECITRQESDKKGVLDEKTYLFGVFKDTGNIYFIPPSNTL